MIPPLTLVSSHQQLAYSLSEPWTTLFKGDSTSLNLEQFEERCAKAVADENFKNIPLEEAERILLAAAAAGPVFVLEALCKTPAFGKLSDETIRTAFDTASKTATTRDVVVGCHFVQRPFIKIDLCTVLAKADRIRDACSPQQFMKAMLRPNTQYVDEFLFTLFLDHPHIGTLSSEELAYALSCITQYAQQDLFEMFIKHPCFAKILPPDFTSSKTSIIRNIVHVHPPALLINNAEHRKKQADKVVERAFILNVLLMDDRFLQISPPDLSKLIDDIFVYNRADFLLLLTNPRFNPLFEALDPQFLLTVLRWFLYGGNLPTIQAIKQHPSFLQRLSPESLGKALVYSNGEGRYIGKCDYYEGQPEVLLELVNSDYINFVPSTYIKTMLIFAARSSDRVHDVLNDPWENFFKETLKNDHVQLSSDELGEILIEKGDNERIVGVIISSPRSLEIAPNYLSEAIQKHSRCKNAVALMKMHRNYNNCCVIV